MLVMFNCFPAQVRGMLYFMLLVPSVILVCMGFPLLSFSVMPFIFHWILPSFSGTPVCVVIVAVIVFSFPAVITGLFIVICGVFLFTVIVRVIFVLLYVIVIGYVPAWLSVIGVIVIPLVILWVVLLLFSVIVAVPVCILFLWLSR